MFIETQKCGVSCHNLQHIWAMLTPYSILVLGGQTILWEWENEIIATCSTCKEGIGKKDADVMEYIQV